MKALIIAAILNGIVSVPIMVILMLLVADPAVMGQFVARRRLKQLGWLATGVMAAAVTAMFVLM
jgi:Mn2+/Fe2+ NRAMP family transporter